MLHSIHVEREMICRDLLLKGMNFSLDAACFVRHLHVQNDARRLGFIFYILRISGFKHDIRITLIVL